MKNFTNKAENIFHILALWPYKFLALLLRTDSVFCSRVKKLVNKFLAPLSMTDLVIGSSVINLS